MIAGTSKPSPALVPFEIFTRPSGQDRGPPVSSRLALAEFFSERAQRQTGDTAQKRRDLDLAYEIVLRMGADAKGDRERSRHLHGRPHLCRHPVPVCYGEHKRPLRG